jgi:hypothetical protein
MRRSAGRLVRAAIVLVASATAVVPQPARAGAGADAGADADKAYTSAGDCEQVGAFVPVPVQNVRHLVADDFAVFGEPGPLALVFVTGGRCRNWEVDGVPGADFVFGLVSVVSHPREQQVPSGDGYDVWWLSAGDTSFHARLSALGVFSRHVPGTAYEVVHAPTGAAGMARFEAPWDESPFSVTAVFGEVPAPDFPENIPSTHWARGRHGRVLGTHVNTEAQVEPALVVVDTPAGSPLARILGTGTVAVPGGILRFHHEAVTRLVPDPPAG